MKYANLSVARDNNVNIGDYLQFMIIQQLLEEVGVDKEEITYLDSDDFADYDGEQLVLPISFGVANYMIKDGIISISEKITPLFLAFTLVTTTVDGLELLDHQENVEFFKRHEPVGARDLVTYRALVKHGIASYLAGCNTLLLPKVEHKPDGKVLFVDTPRNLLSYIPEHLKRNFEVYSQIEYFEDIDDFQQIFKVAIERYGKISKASLVVTSRLHVAVPCLAMGVPVILARDFFDYRFSWIGKLTATYSREAYDSIKWQPEIREFDELKAVLRSIAISRLSTGKVNPEDCDFVTSFYKNVDISGFIPSHTSMHKYTQYFDTWAEGMDKTSTFKFALWGLSESGHFFFDRIMTVFPEAKLVAAVDSYKSGIFKGCEIQKPESVLNQIRNNDCFLIVTSVSASHAAVETFRNEKLPFEKLCLPLESFLTKSDLQRNEDEI